MKKFANTKNCRTFVLGLRMMKVLFLRINLLVISFSVINYVVSMSGPRVMRRHSFFFDIISLPHFLDVIAISGYNCHFWLVKHLYFADFRLCCIFLGKDPYPYCLFRIPFSSPDLYPRPSPHMLSTQGRGFVDSLLVTAKNSCTVRSISFIISCFLILNLAQSQC